MADRFEDLCPRPSRPISPPPDPLPPALYLASVYRCKDPGQAASVLAGDAPGYAYCRDGHPNADMLAEKCRQLHGAERAVVTSSGMSALALALVSQLQQGDHVIVGNQLYGRSLLLWTSEAARLGIRSSVIDSCDLAATANAVEPRTRMVVCETISNPVLRVCDIEALAQLAHDRGALLLADNTLAGPAICRPATLGADLVVESLSKAINGHSDVILGLLCGTASTWERVPSALSTWGLNSAPFDCWLVERGLGTLPLRSERAMSNALEAANFLAGRREVKAVSYPGLASHPDHRLARRQFGEQFGSVVTFTLAGGQPAAEAFIAGADQIPFCPSLGELSTTLSHPLSTSHRGLTDESREALGIDGGTIRLSVGIESSESIVQRIAQALEATR